MPRLQLAAGPAVHHGGTSSPDAEGDAFVNGSLSGELTIGTANDVVVDGKINYVDRTWTTVQSGEAGSFLSGNNNTGVTTHWA